MNRLMNPNSREVRIMSLVYIIAGILLFILNNDIFNDCGAHIWCNLNRNWWHFIIYLILGKTSIC